MLLVVDIGNSFIKWACCRNGILSEFGRENYKKPDITKILDKFWKKLPRPDQVKISNVGGTGVAQAISTWTDENWQLKPVMAKVSSKQGNVTNAYLDYQTLGIDRWLALLAAWHKFTNACCIVDCGTAITIDVIDKSGNHLGGLILPGVMLMEKTLQQTSDALIQTGEIKTQLSLAGTTRDGIHNGCTLAVVATIDRAVSEMVLTLGSKVNCIITGGDAPEIIGLLKHKYIHLPHLVLEGLAIIEGPDK